MSSYFPSLCLIVLDCLWSLLGRQAPTLSSLKPYSREGCYPFAHLFNGALVSSVAISEIGNVNPDFFIFGDEVDYFFRLRSKGDVVSVLAAANAS